MVTHDSDLADRVMRKVTLADGVVISDEWLRDVHDDVTRANLGNSQADQDSDEQSSVDDLATDAPTANEPTVGEESDIIVANEESDATSDQNNV